MPKNLLADLHAMQADIACAQEAIRSAAVRDSVLETALRLRLLATLAQVDTDTLALFAAVAEMRDRPASDLIKNTLREAQRSRA